MHRGSLYPRLDHDYIHGLDRSTSQYGISQTGQNTPARDHRQRTPGRVRLIYRPSHGTVPLPPCCLLVVSPLFGCLLGVFVCRVMWAMYISFMCITRMSIDVTGVEENNKSLRCDFFVSYRWTQIPILRS